MYKTQSSILIGLTVLVGLLVLASQALAVKRFSREFDAPPDTVYGLILKITQRDYFQLGSDREKRIVTFEMESHWNDFKLNAAVTPTANGGSSVEIAAQKAQGKMYIQYGKASGTAEKFFQKLQDEIDRSRPGSSASGPPRSSQPLPGVDSSPPAQPKPEVPADGSSVVVVKSTPNGADITLDEKYVGSTPSSLRAAPGDHTVAVERQVSRNGNARSL